MSTLRVSERLPTHAQIVDFFATILPPHSQDVPLRWHVPRWSGYDADSIVVRDIVLSVTPTPGVFRRLDRLARGRQKAVCFLHRPFQLDRRALPKGSLVLANHKRFDELLTTGYNTALATRLGLVVNGFVCIKGYKGDPSRRIGLVAALMKSQSIGVLQSTITAEFGEAELHWDDGEWAREIRAVALMNAFGPDEVARALVAAEEAGLVPKGDASGLLYLTGQPREPGLQAAGDIGMSVVCVGHRSCEEWGIRYLAYLLQRTWTRLGVHVVLEEELPFVNPVVKAI